MQDKLERIRKISRIATGIVWVVEWLLLASIAISLFSWVMHSAQLHLSFVLTGLSSLVGTLGMMGMFWIILKLLKSLRSERSPFVPENIRRFRSIGRLLAFLAVLQFVTDVVVSCTLSFMERPVSDGMAVAVQQVGFHYASLVMLVLALVVYCISLAFEYGAHLQQQDDETL